MLAALADGETYLQIQERLGVSLVTIWRWAKRGGDVLTYKGSKTKAPSPRPEGSTTILGCKVRFSIMERDGFKCRYCGATPESVRLTVDHIIPVSKGGSDHPDNLVTACCQCNMGKGNRQLMNLPPGVEPTEKMVREP